MAGKIRKIIDEILKHVGKENKKLTEIMQAKMVLIGVTQE
jgi:hypothetical protein